MECFSVTRAVPKETCVNLFISFSVCLILAVTGEGGANPDNEAATEAVANGREPVDGEAIVKAASIKYQELIKGKTEEEKMELLKPILDWYDQIMELSQEKTRNGKANLKKCAQENYERVSSSAEEDVPIND